MKSLATAKTSHVAVGRWGEDIAGSVLACNGYSLLERNWRPPLDAEVQAPRGELDLIMVDPEMNLVFIEVKTRSSADFGHPFEAISREKAKKLRALAFAWVRSQETFDFQSMRIDALAVCGTPQRFTVEHLMAVA